MSWRSEDGNWVWSFALVPENSSTRLISRNRARVRTLAERVGMAGMDAGSLVMERKNAPWHRAAGRAGRGLKSMKFTTPGTHT